MGATTNDAGAAGALFGKTRRLILALLFLHSDESCYFRQITTLTGVGQGAAERELSNLVNAGLVTCARTANQVYYQANRQSPIFADLRALLIKTVGLADVIRQALLPFSDRIIAAFVYTPAAGGEERPDNALGVLVVGSVDARDVTAALRPAREQLGRQIEPSVFSWTEFTTRKTRRDRSLDSVLSGPKAFVIGDEGELGIGGNI
ncbi:MAG: winged helix-turn-helix domain-containing protein [Armatimonadota bacterium]|nr:winged helix-turn-helix domain-containing protein [Armatimonadota bacterium]